MRLACSISCLLLLASPLVAQTSSSRNEGNGLAVVPSLHLGHDNRQSIAGASVALGALTGPWELRTTLARQFTTAGGCVDDCPVTMESSGDLGLLYRIRRERTSIYFGGGGGLADWFGLRATLHAEAGHSRAVGQRTFIRFEVKALQALQGHRGTGSIGQPTRHAPIHQVMVSVGFGLLAPLNRQAGSIR